MKKIELFIVVMALILLIFSCPSSISNTSNSGGGGSDDTERPGRYIWVTGENTIDYSKPKLYLQSGPQTNLNDTYFNEIQAQLDIIGDSIEDIIEVYKWKNFTFTSYSGGGVLIGIATANSIYVSKELSGCHDHGLIIAAVLRKLGYPVIYVDTANVQWAKDYHDGNVTNFHGHIFLEVYVNGKWVLFDSTSGHYVLDYDYNSNSITTATSDEYFSLIKGLDTNHYGVYSSNELNQNHLIPFSDVVYDLTWDVSNYTVYDPDNYINNINDTCNVDHNISITINYEYTGTEIVDASHPIMLQLDKYTNGTVIQSVNNITTSSGIYTFNFTDQVEYVFVRMGYDKDGSGWYTAGDYYAWYIDKWQLKKAVRVSDGPVEIDLTLDDSNVY